MTCRHRAGWGRACQPPMVLSQMAVFLTHQALLMPVQQIYRQLRWQSSKHRNFLATRNQWKAETLSDWRTSPAVTFPARPLHLGVGDLAQ
ncbi:unnamed protein product, partial [Symbiodinium necroappetens]